MCSLRPTNDYKTTVLAGLNPVTILEICGRAISFWNYQVSQENSFQHAMFKNANEKMAQMQKHLDNVIREANGQISLLQDKVGGLERELELERRRAFDLQEVSRERDKDYQKLKTQLDKYKRKAVLSQNTAMATGVEGPDMPMEEAPAMLQGMSSQPLFGGPNGLLTTPSHRQRDFQPDMHNTVHASRARPMRMNPPQPQSQYPVNVNEPNMSPNHAHQNHNLMGHGGRIHRASGLRYPHAPQPGIVQGMPFTAPVRNSHRRPTAYQSGFPG
ncbi:hypothetical protein CALVIDRAFT_51396 [Calocera viscosa TUFC12733]|uniref:E3 ubiquitin-protein ligase CCNB1IP1 n=1 Tax=Calocera viscosa (strain TUFC12733) TaxID=1330018 RepID=A0A167NSL5_CALVF|nr:hypothetical protein CALVIDRAFT_51396 [Calocera viscosa TUFC12733]